jgi:hypothetical protein
VSEPFPWQAEAAGVVLLVGRLGYKYIKEALDFVEDNQEQPSAIISLARRRLISLHGIAFCNLPFLFDTMLLLGSRL